MTWMVYAININLSYFGKLKKSKIKKLADLVPGEGSWVFVCVFVLLGYKNYNPINNDSVLMTSALPKDSISEQYHIRD